jgi:hypothetical protein
MDKFDQKVILDDNLMVDFICSEMFSTELLNFLCETKYLDFLANDLNDTNSSDNIKKILNAVVNNKLIPYRIIRNKIDLRYDANEWILEEEILHKSYLNYLIFDINDEEFTFFFDNVIKLLPVQHALILAELVLSKSLNFPRIVYEYLSEKDGVNLLRLLLKYEKFDVNLVVKLITSKSYLPILEINIV